MMSVESLREFLGWCTVINMAMLLVATIFAGPLRGAVQGIHAKMFGLSEEDLARAYFQYVAQYKIVTVIFNLVPYLQNTNARGQPKRVAKLQFSSRGCDTQLENCRKIRSRADA